MKTLRVGQGSGPPPQVPKFGDLDRQFQAVDNAPTAKSGGSFEPNERKPPRQGPIWPHSDTGIKRARTDLMRKIYFKWIPDGLRHSWISNRLVLVKHEGQAEQGAGNFAEVIYKYSRTIKSKVDAEAWIAVKLR